MKAKLFADVIGPNFTKLSFVDQEINRFLANNEVQILDTHYTTTYDPQNEMLINTALVWYEGSAE